MNIKETGATLIDKSNKSTGGNGEAAQQREAAKRTALCVASSLEEGKASRITILDVHDMTFIADYFVIASGTSQRHVKALVDRLQKDGAAVRAPNHVEGYPQARWILLDYGDVVVHVFEDEERSFYGLERLWGDAPKVPY